MNEATTHALAWMRKVNFDFEELWFATSTANREESDPPPDKETATNREWFDWQERQFEEEISEFAILLENELARHLTIANGEDWEPGEFCFSLGGPDELENEHVDGLEFGGGGKALEAFRDLGLPLMTIAYRQIDFRQIANLLFDENEHWL